MPITLTKPFFLLIWLLTSLIWIMLRQSPGHGYSRPQRRLIGGVHSLLIVILGLTLADPRLLSVSDQVNLLFCVDVSQSIGSEATAAVETFMRTTLESMDADDQAGLVVFGKHPALEMALRPDFEPPPRSSEVNRNFTNLYEALQFAVGKLPQSGVGKIVLFTDGQENLQHAADIVPLAASLGVAISPVPLSSWFGPQEVYIKTVETPSTVPLATPYEINVVILSSQAQTGELILVRNDTLLATRTVNLQSGKNVVTFADTLDDPGLYLYKAVINAPVDGFFQNNEGLAFVRSTRKAQILYVTESDRATDPLAATLTMQGLELTQRPIGEVRGALHDLLEYNAILLDNVSGQTMPFSTMEQIEHYVKDLGGGLLMIGGDQSFGAGLYQKTPIEDALPVFMDAPTDLKLSDLGLIFVLDKSSSMSTRYNGKSKLEMAKIATFSAVELLNPTDRVGIIAFDSDFEWFVPITPARARQEIANELAQIREAGGTVLYPALEDVLRVLQQETAARKHVIVLSDGRTEEADFQTLVQAMRSANISVSTVSIGRDADRKLMRSIARWGEGRSYYTDDPNAIPRIFTGEMKIVAKELIVEETMQPAAASAHEIVQGIDTAALPVLEGQVLTYPKPGANVILQTEQGPLLAAWQYGLGRSVAFTSDLASRWGTAWVRWDQYGQFAAQMVKWAQRRETERRYAAQIERQGEAGIVTVDVLDAQQRFVNNLSLRLNLLSPSDARRSMALEQIAPGRYQARFSAEEIGAYYLSVFGAAADEPSRPQVFGFGVPYTDEFRSAGVNLPLLERLASLTGGRGLSLEHPPDDLFQVQSAAQASAGIPLWPYGLLAFLGLLLADVAIRKVLMLRVTGR